MKIHQIISETPLPDTWDKKVFKNETPYHKRIEYAVARAQQLGQGSSRTAFTIEYQGRKTVLKVAHDEKGMAQNEAEAYVLTNAKKSNMVIPIIDYDKENNKPTWIHTEFAESVDEYKLKFAFKTTSLKDLIKYADILYADDSDELYSIKNKVKEYYDNDKEDVKTFVSYAKKIAELRDMYDLEIYDLARVSNWGLYKNRPVIIDVGLTYEVNDEHYS